MDAATEKKKPGTAFPQNPPAQSIYGRGAPGAQPVPTPALPATPARNTAFPQNAPTRSIYDAPQGNTGVGALVDSIFAPKAQEAAPPTVPATSAVAPAPVATAQKPEAPAQAAEAPSEYGRQMGEVANFFGDVASGAVKTIVSAPGYGMSRVATAPQAPAAPQAAYSNEGRNYPTPSSTAASPIKTSGAPTADLSQQLAGLPAKLPVGSQEGVIYKTKGVNGGTVYSGSNVGAGAEFVDGYGMRIQPKGGVSVVPGMPQAEIERRLTNPNGTRWTANDNAIMAANLRDGIDPYRGTSAQTQDASAAGIKVAQVIEDRMAYKKRDRELEIAAGSIRNSPQERAAYEQRRAELRTEFENGNLSREKMTAEQAANQARLAVDQQRVGIEQQRAGTEQQRVSNDVATGAQTREARGMEISAARQLAGLQAQYMAATDRNVRQQLARQLATLSGKYEGGMKPQVIRGSDTLGDGGQVIRGGERLIGVDPETGQVMDLTPSGAAAAKPSGQQGGFVQGMAYKDPVSGEFAEWNGSTFVPIKSQK